MAVRLAIVICALAMLQPALFAADVIVVNGDPPGVGFNDPTPATPVGGNPGQLFDGQAFGSR